jgi:hypothetical protein
MSEKVDRYVGLVFWLLVILWFWFFNHNYESFLYSIEQPLKLADRNSLVVQWCLLHHDQPFFEPLLKAVFRTPLQYAQTIWWISVITAIYSAWRFRHIPMKVIRRMAKTFDKYV